ncbi:uncharacterized protein M421DRAFT_294270 [Didymella exigua CBS 183.55]|uniref:Uncharacterized protein n=1 Tax=Didymella exigua CBS 183.55 TaxID=1150837 RepID=A0A6A5R934_9PLEO|nr:uncharacterized protein M421DRAFT_294270 [Didymella exigua CBS 183.55]KAF1924252.1 hypothetical protein M421DRAFT_294270 [Didymella exigua CBS 183.55]
MQRHVKPTASNTYMSEETTDAPLPPTKSAEKVTTRAKVRQQNNPATPTSKHVATPSR